MEKTNEQLAEKYQKDGFLTGLRVADNSETTHFRKEYDASDAENAVDLVLNAGEMSIHHGKIIHGSLPNNSTRRRCGLTIRYIPPSVKQAEDNSLKRPWKPILLRGEDHFQNFTTVPNPFPLSE